MEHLVAAIMMEVAYQRFIDQGTIAHDTPKNRARWIEYRVWRSAWLQPDFMFSPR